MNPHGKGGCFIWARLIADRLGNIGCVKSRSSKKRMRTCGAAIFFLREVRNFEALKIILWCGTLYIYGVYVLQRWRCLNNLSCFTLWNRWDYSNPGYLDALKHLTDLKEEGYTKSVLYWSITAFLDILVVLLFSRTVIYIFVSHQILLLKRMQVKLRLWLWQTLIPNICI